MMKALKLMQYTEIMMASERNEHRSLENTVYSITAKLI
jgi:hypothetical protein